MREGALPPGLRQTAANRPGQAQPVPTRDIPALPWMHMGSIVFMLLVLLLAAWEWQTRRLDLRAGDLGDSPQAWAEQRSLADNSPVTIVGDSRILFDTDLDRFQALTGVRPIQASIVGTTARAILMNFANDPGFHGLLILGLAETSYYRPSGVGLGKPYMDNFSKNGKPSQVSGLLLDRYLQRHVAFLDPEYRLSRMVNELDRGIRSGVDSPYDDVWKISETFDRRQYFMWDRINHDLQLRMHARWAWGEFKGKPIPPRVIARVNARSAEAVRRIRARGGDVIFIRPPSSPELRVHEEARVPKAKAWEGLLAAADAQGIHADDLPQAQKLVLPEWSHLTRECARVFTDAYVRRLTELTPRLKLRADAPPPLTRADCVPQRLASRR
ncbi:MAG TPA: hypothetical protein VF067_06890 [Sphingomicrobium sp.]